MYINEIDDYCSQNCLTLYAYDTVVKQKRESKTEAFSQCFCEVSDHLTKNRLTLSYEKTCLMNIKAIRKSSQQQPIIKKEPNTEIITENLRIELDDNLNFDE